MSRVFLSMIMVVCFLTGFSQERIVHDDHAVVRDVPEFHSVELSGSINLIVNKGDQKLVVSAADREDVANIETKVENGVLKIRLKAEEKWWKSKKLYNRRLQAYISSNELKEITTVGSGNVQFQQYQTRNNFMIRQVGSGNYEGEFVSSGLKVILAGSGNVRLKGKADKLDVNLSGSGNVTLYNLNVEDAIAVINGSGNIEVTINKTLEASINGSGNIDYKGTGRLTKSKIAGSGKINKL